MNGILRGHSDRMPSECGCECSESYPGTHAILPLIHLAQHIPSAASLTQLYCPAFRFEQPSLQSRHDLTANNVAISRSLTGWVIATSVSELQKDFLNCEKLAE